MPRAKKDTSLQNIGKIDSNKSINTLTGYNLTSSSNIQSEQQIKSTSSRKIIKIYQILKIFIFSFRQIKTFI
jgi:hypothetical protein